MCVCPYLTPVSGIPKNLAYCWHASIWRSEALVEYEITLKCADITFLESRVHQSSYECLNKEDLQPWKVNSPLFPYYSHDPFEDDRMYRA